MASLATHFIFISLAFSFAQCLLLDCFIDNEECEIHGDNHIETFMGVSSFYECSSLCQDNSACTAFTYYETDSHPLTEACFLFSTCATRRGCENCVTGSSQESCTCSVKFDGDISGDNFVELVSDVPNELACKKNCTEHDDCSIYTFYDENDQLYPNVCFLLGSDPSGGLRRPVVPCENCSSGPARCKVRQQCQVSVLTNGVEAQDLLVKENTTLVFKAGEKECYAYVRFLVIGGGGGPSNYEGGPGGGSGHIAQFKMRLSNEDGLVVTIGRGGHTNEDGGSSKVKKGGSSAEAPGGKAGDLQDGGDGYSGGGAYHGGHGGTDGGDGEDIDSGKGGHGSGLDLELMVMEHFELTAGRGGNGSNHGGGGGGGGVLVNGYSSPDIGNGVGEGYGGGGGQLFETNSGGMDGCVLLELI